MPVSDTGNNTCPGFQFLENLSYSGFPLVDTFRIESA